MTHKAKVGDTVRWIVSGNDYGKEFVVTALFTNNTADGVYVQMNNYHKGGLLYEHQYEVVKRAEPEMYLSFDISLKVGTTVNFTRGQILNKEQAEAHINSHQDAVTYKLVPVNVKEVDVTIKKKVIA